jgi:hypothetical protein
MKHLMLVLVAVAAEAGCSTGTNGRGAELVSCSPGMDITIACGVGGLGSCTGDPILTICDGSIATDPLTCESASSPGFIDRNDDAGTGADRLCSSVTVMCPASGSIAVRPSAFSGIPTCNWETRVGGP